MAIAKKPNRQQPGSAEQQASRFIEGAGRPVSRAKRLPTTLRFDQELLARIDTAAKRRGISRSAWIQYTLSRALDEGGRVRFMRTNGYRSEELSSDSHLVFTANLTPSSRAVTKKERK